MILEFSVIDHIERLEECVITVAVYAGREADEDVPRGQYSEAKAQHCNRMRHRPIVIETVLDTFMVIEVFSKHERDGDERIPITLVVRSEQQVDVEVVST